MSSETKQLKRLNSLVTQQYKEATLRHPRLLAQSVLHPLGSLTFSILIPYVASQILTSLLREDGRVTGYLYWMAFFVLLGILCNRFGFAAMMRIQAIVMGELHQKVFRSVLDRGTSFHTNQIGGKLVSDAIDYVGSYSALFQAVFVSAVPFALTILIGLMLVFVGSWIVGLYIAVVVIITLIWAYYDSSRRHRLRHRRLKATKALTAHLSDSLVNAQTVKTFAREEDETGKNKALNKTVVELRLHDWLLAGRSGNNRIATLLMLQLFLLILLTYLSRRGLDVLAVGIFAFTYVLTITSRLFEINNITRQIEDAYLQASPMAEILTEEIEITDVPDAKELAVQDGGISLEHVTFHYKDASQDRAVFSDLSLTVRPGERVGLVGPSGGGKSTLTRLLLRFEDIDSGEILIDGQNIAKVTQASLRRAISYVPQEPLLFHRSILENIAYGKPGANMEEVVRAAKKANAHEFIERLPQGYDTIVGERGVKLSGGQRQRVAIARAILKDAPVLVLDEATSALDSESEVLIQDALWELMKDRTAIVIAHRLSTIQKMDRILVLDNGMILEDGTHNQLLDADGLYAKLWSHQSGGFIEE